MGALQFYGCKFCWLHAKANNKKQCSMTTISTKFLLLSWIAATIIVTGQLVQTTSALKVSVSIPELVKLNEAFWLNCSHQKPLASAGLDSNQVGEVQKDEEDIYAIKWFKDNEEFYKYLPNANPKVSIYETNGIQLDQAKSHEGNVYLNKADVNTEGEYRCEILSEAPLFETVRKSKHLKVYALPVKSPKIDILDSNGRARNPKDHDISYTIGDKIDLICNSAPSKPAARLRWYLNDREIQVSTANSTLFGGSRRQRRALGALQHHPTGAIHSDVKVSPIEYRQHYKGIYSSHSTLSLVLQQEDLINNKISFKCLASMRQEIPFKSKQLIVLMQAARLSNGNSVGSSRLKRSSPLSALSSDFQATLAGLATDNEAHVHHRQRPSHHRHSISRLSHPPPIPAPQPDVEVSPFRRPQAQLQQQRADNNNQMWYIYEEADSTLGPSIIDKPEDLESYLKRHGASLTNDSSLDIAGQLQPLEFNRADNVEYIQVLRDRQARQRTYANNLHQMRTRLHSPVNFVKSPYYSDEHDPIRPIISWPPLDSGKLFLSGNSLVALPTKIAIDRRSSDTSTDRRFIVQPKATEPDSMHSPIFEQGDLTTDQIMLERLMNSLNCTSTDAAIDTKMSWLVNDMPLDLRDTKLFPTRVSSDHRQTLLTIGLQVPSSSKVMASSSARYISPATSSPVTLRSVLAQYYKSPQTAQASGPANHVLGVTGQQNSQYDQIKFTCQALYTMLLYSSSEIITFDFSPHSLVDGNSIDKPLLPSNVIIATSASQSSSANGWTVEILSTRSQTNLVLTITTLVLFVLASRR